MKLERSLWLAVLAAWALWLALAQPWQGDAHQRTAAKVRLLFPQLAAQQDQVAKVLIRDGNKHTTLELSDEASPYGPGRWLVKEKLHPAEGERLARLVAGLAQLKTIDLVATEASSLSQYGVAEGEGTHVQLFAADDTLLADWIAGKIRAQDVQQGQKAVFEYYMRDGRSTQVYLSADPIQPPSDPVDWCDTTFLATLDMDTVTAVERQDFRGEDNWRLVKMASAEAAAADAEGQPSAWRLAGADGPVALKFAVDSLLFTLSNLRAADVISPRTTSIPEEDARYGFPQDRFQIEVGEEKLQLDLGKPAPGGQRYLRVTGLPHIYTLSDFDVGQLRQTRARLLTRDG